MITTYLEKIKKSVLAAAIILLSAFAANASHIVGGQIEYRWVTGNDYEVKVTFYRDCLPGTAGVHANVQVCFYDKVTNASSFNVTILRDYIDTLALGDQCYTPPNMCVEASIFRDTITIPANPNGYYMVYGTCCRNSGITNIQAGSMLWYTEMPDPALHNSGPVFNNFPKAYFCQNFPNFENLSATDPDGDSLVYRMVTPLNVGGCQAKPVGGYAKVVYIAAGGHSETLPMGSATTLANQPTVDPVTGIMRVEPASAGLYVLGYVVEEWRNGIKIGEVRRDFQYKVLTCSPNLPPYFTSEPSYNNYTIAAGEEICFDVRVSDLNGPFGGQPANGVYFTYTSEMLGALGNGPKVTITPLSDDTVLAPDTTKINVCIKTQCSDIRPNPYRLIIHGNDTSCYGVNTVDYQLDLLVVLPGIVDLYPNVFTPNGDSKNDKFRTNALPPFCFDEFEVLIYNRWGNLVYTSNNFDFEWDGKNKNGKDMDDGVYYYTLKSKFQDVANEERGFVHLIR